MDNKKAKNTDKKYTLNQIQSKQTHKFTIINTQTDTQPMTNKLTRI